MIEEPTFRVVSDGVLFKVQRRYAHRFLWWRWEEWSDLCELRAGKGWYAFPVKYYNYKEDAEHMRDRMEKMEQARHEWRPVVPTLSSPCPPCLRGESCGEP